MLSWHEYHKYLKGKQAEEDTITNRKVDISQFLTSFSTLEQQDVDGFVKMLLEKDYKGTTIQRKISSLRDFGKANGVNVIPTVSVPPAERNLAKIHENLMEEGEYREYLDKILTDEDNSFEGLRAKMIFVMLAYGFRRIGIINITVGGVDLKSGKFHFLTKKDRFRVLPIVFYKDIIKEYLQARISRDYINVNNLIVYSYRNEYKQIRPREFYDIYYTALAKVTDREINPHAWRHTFGTRLVDNGMDLDEVRDAMGHASINSTELYVHLSGERIRDGLQKFHPSGHKK